MAFIPRLFRLNSNCFGFSGTGSSASYASQKILPASAYFGPDFKNKNYEPKAYKRFYGSNMYSKTNSSINTAIGTTLRKVNLPQIVKNADNLPRGYLIAAFNKLCMLYNNYKWNLSNENRLAYYLQEEQFKDFCKIIEKELPKLKPSDLVTLLQLVNFKVSPKSVLMRKIYTLILDYLHCFPVIDLLDLYSMMKSPYHEKVQECIAIRESCEEYFKTSFEDDLTHNQNYEELIYFISNPNLPIEVRKLITEKCLEMNHFYIMRGYPKFFESAFNEPIASLYRTELLEKLNSILNDYPLPKIISIFSDHYKNGIYCCDSLYDQELCDGIGDRVKSIKYKMPALSEIVRNLCIMGHFHQEAVDRLAETVLSRNVLNISPKNYHDIISVLTRVSYHEMNNPNWETIKNLLMSYDIMGQFCKYPNRLFQCCKCLTYLGCDTASLIKTIFQKFGNNPVIMTGSESRSVLRLYHLAKKYFPDENFELKNLDCILQNAVYKKSIRLSALLHEFFGSEDYVIYNATTPDVKFLPFVVNIGNDGRPINLISYKPQTQHLGFNKNFKSITNIKHLEQTESSKIIVFLPYPDGQPFKFRNAPLESGHYRMFLQSYEDSDFNIILLPLKYFDLEPDLKIQYLQTEFDKVMNNLKTEKENLREQEVE